ncbi:MAG: RuvX/YqgF family protein [Dehalococcoidia bacterium]|jgi:hypothetical protein|nr:RuvX/YqgF family protein [Dehalococcoidia bacterium]
MAVVSSTRGLLARRVEPAAALADSARRIMSTHAVTTIVVGDRTACVDTLCRLREVTSVPVVTVDEHRSSMEGRERYLRENPGRGIARFLPPGLRSPDRPFDDYVAEVLATRYFAQRRGGQE